MISNSPTLLRCFAVAILLVGATGCGTTRRSDTGRTALEQLLISDAVDQAVARVDFSALAGKEVYFDPQYLGGTVDEKYLVSTIRQHLLHHGCILQEDRSEATYVVEARAGAVGTNRHDVMIGIPAINLPSAMSFAGVPSSIPEVPFAKSTDQRGVAKIAMFAYNRETGRSLWQSGTRPVASRSKDLWILGAGPFQRGSIYDGTKFAGSSIFLPLVNEKQKRPDTESIGRVTGEVFFSDSQVQIAQSGSDTAASDDVAAASDDGVVPASAEQPVASPPLAGAAGAAGPAQANPYANGEPRLLEAAPAEVRPIEKPDGTFPQFPLVPGPRQR